MKEKFLQLLEQDLKEIFDPNTQREGVNYNELINAIKTKELKFAEFIRVVHKTVKPFFDEIKK